MVPFLIFVGFAIFFIMLGVLSVRAARKRSEALSGVAPQLGLQFAATDETGLQAGFAGFQLFSWGRARTLSNITYGRLEGDVEVMLFDYRYTTGSGKHKNTRLQTVCFFQSDSLTLPEFVARPENVFDKIGEVFGGKDIDLPMHPEFSRRYLLKGADESAVRDAFTVDVARFFEANPGLSVEAMTDRFILYRSGRRLKPEEWGAWVEKGLQVVRVLPGKR